MMAEFDNYLARKRREHGDKFDPSDLHEHFIPHFNSGQRVKVKGPFGERTGRVGVTTGWKPSFLLVHRSNAMGSSDLLGKEDRVIGVQRRSRGYDPPAPTISPPPPGKKRTATGFRNLSDQQFGGR